MNELTIIEALAEQAGYKDLPTVRLAFQGFDKEKFAELIVQECVEQIVAKGTDWVDFAPSQTGVRPEYWAMAQQIEQHFGVEE